MATITETVSVQPDISYAPDFEKYQARTARRLGAEQLESKLPPGFPKALDSTLAWEGTGLEEKYEWTYSLSKDQLEEVEQALRHFKSLGLPLGNLNQETFPLPNLHTELRRLSHELHFGHGFFVLRGLDVDKFARDENVIIYVGISSHIASLRGRQDHQFDGRPASVVLTHIKDLSKTSVSGKIGAPAYTTEKQVFHTDQGDLVSLFALETAVSGGKSKLASSWRVYNELASTRPDLIRTLSEDWVADIPSKEKPYTIRPLMYYQPPTTSTPERILLQYARRNYTGYGAMPRSHEIAPITEAQAEALDAMHFLGEKFNVALDFQKGDIQYINNLSVFHARDSFVDSPTQQRHLLRLWLRDPEYAWETPDQLKERWAGLYDGVTPESEVFPLQPFVRSGSSGSRKPEVTESK